jgi:hypothetical protein
MLKLSSCDVGVRHLFVYTNKDQMTLIFVVQCSNVFSLKNNPS